MRQQRVIKKMICEYTYTKFSIWAQEAKPLTYQCTVTHDDILCVLLSKIYKKSYTFDVQVLKQEMRSRHEKMSNESEVEMT